MRQRKSKARPKKTLSPINPNGVQFFFCGWSGVAGSRFRVWGRGVIRYKVLGFRFGIYGWGFRVKGNDSGCMVKIYGLGSEVRVQNFGIRV